MPCSLGGTASRNRHSTSILLILVVISIVAWISSYYSLRSATAPAPPSAETKITMKPNHTKAFDNKTRGNNTIVTAYYELESKHSNKNYRTWIDNFLSLDDPMVIFTSASLVPLLSEGRAKYNASHKTKVIALELNETNTTTMFALPFWESQYLKDPERRIHKSYQLYWVWLSKPEFIKRAIAMDPFHSDFFAWVDSGYFRNKDWNGQRMLQHIPPALRQDQVLMLDMTGSGIPPPNGRGFSVGGGFIGGYSKGILRWNRLFYTFLKEHQSEFIGKDQSIMYRTCFTQSPPPCLLVKHGHDHGDPWFYMAPFLILGLNETSLWEPSIKNDSTH